MIKNGNIDKNSFDLGMIEAFCEIVHQGVKPLALSPILDKEAYHCIKESAHHIAEKFDVSDYVDFDFISTDLAGDDEIQGKVIILYYKDNSIIQAYDELKNQISHLKTENRYTAEEKKRVSIEFRKLLGYSDEAIKRTYN